MHKTSRLIRNKEHQIAISKRGIRLRTKTNKALRRRQNNCLTGNCSPHTRRRGNTQHSLVAPVKFDIFSETSTTIEFFSEVISTINTCKFGDILFFDLSKIEYITPDAVMYLIAVIRNTKKVRQLNLKCCGNLPKTPSARALIENVGFYAYVRKRDGILPIADDSYAKILCGSDADCECAGAFCDFVQQHCNCNMLGTKRLYPMIMELMTNTHQHAYKSCEKEIMDSNWYIFAQYVNNEVEFIFLDTGAGIPATVRKGFLERIRILKLTDDASLLDSVLHGDFRTETRQKNRGKGIPGIYENSCDGAIVDLCIVSGEGKCYVHGAQTLHECIESKFNGTIYSWKLRKGVTSK